uniref:Uncharacterized protein n=1 Tax=Borely moumouvirus TaxID=2712067 RepID=A0A6G6ACZ0_9VIRU
MSVSKEYYNFPYCNYPYTFYDKLSFYSSKTTCFFMKLCGIGIYSKLIFGHKHHSRININNTSLVEINDLVKYHKSKIKTTLAYGIISGLIASPIMIGLFRNNYIDHDYLLLGQKTIIIFSLHNIYKIICHIYNNVQLSTKYNTINHAIKIMNYVENNNMGENFHKKKTKWIKYLDETNNYCIYNSYYLNLLCIFENEYLADEFIKNLQQLSIPQIDELSENMDIFDKMRNDFIKDKTYIYLMNKYKDIYKN